MPGGRKVSNTLNDLTPQEWIKFQKSWFVISSHVDERKARHPATFPDELAEAFIRFFTKEGQWVLDPMVGSGSTLCACFKTGRNGIGIELVPKWAQLAQQRLEELRRQPSLLAPNNTQQIVIVADARNIDTIDMPPIDYVLTSPPYWDMLRWTKKKKRDYRQKKGFDIYYSDDPADLGNIEDYDLFLTELVSIYSKVKEKMRSGAYMTIIVRNVTKGSKFYPLAWELALKLREFFILCDEKIWCQEGGKLRPFGYPTTWVSNTFHHYCLILRKP